MIYWKDFTKEKDEEKVEEDEIKIEVKGIGWDLWLKIVC